MKNNKEIQGYRSGRYDEYYVFRLSNGRGDDATVSMTYTHTNQYVNRTTK